MSKIRMQHCFNCGEELGVYEQSYGGLDTCGKLECEREARAVANEEREQAHEQLDRDMGWERI